MPVVVTGRRPICWKCGETGNLSFSCPEKNASGVLAPAHPNTPLVENAHSVSSLMGIPATGTGVVTPPLGSISQPSFPEKTLPAVRTVARRNRGNCRNLPETLEITLVDLLLPYMLSFLSPTPVTLMCFFLLKTLVLLDVCCTQGIRIPLSDFRQTFRNSFSIARHRQLCLHLFHSV